jgi:hypothetical protein
MPTWSLPHFFRVESFDRHSNANEEVPALDTHKNLPSLDFESPATTRSELTGSAHCYSFACDGMENAVPEHKVVLYFPDQLESKAQKIQL